MEDEKDLLKGTTKRRVRRASMKVMLGAVLVFGGGMLSSNIKKR